MWMYRSALIVPLLMPIFIFSEDSVMIKVAPNSSVSHEINLSFSLDQELEGKKNKVVSVKTETLSDLSYLLSNEIPELKISQEKSLLDFQAGPLNIKYRLDEEYNNNTFWRYLRDQMPDSILLPIIDKVDFLRKPNERYSILPIENVQNYIAFVYYFKELTDKGIQFQQGDVFETKGGEKESSYWVKLKVKEITSKDVVVDVEGEFHYEQQIEEAKKVINLGNVLGEIRIDKRNLFLIEGKLGVETKGHFAPVVGEITTLPMIQKGVFNGKLSLEITSKPRDKEF